MDERNAMLMNFMLNETKHLRRFIESSSPFKSQKKGTKPATKALMKGQFLSFSKMIKQFRPFYFELYPNCLIKYQDKTKPPPVEQLQCQSCTVTEENEVVGEQVAFGIIISNSEENEIAKLVTDKFQLHKLWLKALKKYCKVGNFLQRFKVENRIFDHFYRCIDKKKRAYVSVKIVNKKGLKPEQKLFVENEIEVLRRVQCNLLPKLKKVYEDENYIYLTFAAFTGDDLLKIVCTSSLEEIAVATLTYHILKGLRSIHAQNAFHGNLKLENIIFSTGQKENEIFVINFKFIEENTADYRERLIKRGQNNYVAPEVIEGKQFNSQIDLFSLGVCLFYMVFQKFPYARIQRIEGDKWEYELDISILEQMFNEKKKDPSSHQDLSVSGIDFLLKLLCVDPDQRPTAAMALNHHWFINFTNKPTENKKLQKFREAHQMTSLKTILECSELSERELDSASRLFFRRPFNNSNLSNLGSNSNNILLSQSALYNGNLQNSNNQLSLGGNTPSNANIAQHTNSPISLMIHHNNSYPTRLHLDEEPEMRQVSHDETDIRLSEDETEETSTVDILMHKLDRQTPIKWLHPRFSARYYDTQQQQQTNQSSHNDEPHEQHFQVPPQHLSQFSNLDRANMNQNTNNNNLPDGLNNSNRIINNNSSSNGNYFDEQYYQPSSPTYQSPHYTGLEPIIEETTDLKQSTTFRKFNSQSSRHPTVKSASVQYSQSQQIQQQTQLASPLSQSQQQQQKQQQQQQQQYQSSPFQQQQQQQQSQQLSSLQQQLSQGNSNIRTPSTRPSNSEVQ